MLHDYQKYAVRFIEEHPVCALLLSMGLGKTIITLTALQDLLFDSFDAHRILVIAPLRVAQSTWPAEIEKWEQLHELEYSVIKGTPAERLQALKRQADIYIINRENVPWLCKQPFDFDTVVVDELSSFKNHKAKRYKALMSKRPFIKRMIGLTGTPSSNGQSTWPAEIEKWEQLHELEYSVIKGTPAERLQALKRQADIYIINRENGPWLCKQPFDFDTVVVDELSSFKNHKAKGYKALMSKRPFIKRMMGLTGTPSSNGLQDLWAEFRLLNSPALKTTKLKATKP